MVVVAAAADLCTLAQVKAVLSISDGSQDTLLQAWIDTATSVIEAITGPVAQRTVNESHDGGPATIVLRQLPAASVQTVNEYVGQTPSALTIINTPDQATAFSVSFDQTTGTLTRRYGGGIDGAFADGTDNIVVTYTAGLPSIPAYIQQAAIEFVRHWVQGDQAAEPIPGYDTPEPSQALTYAIPNRVSELLQGVSRRLPGIG